MEFHVMSQMEDIRQRLGNVPALRDPGMQIEMFVAVEKGVKEQLAYAFGLGINAHARIKVRGTALDNHHQRICRRLR
jgi:hypothetical protein